MTELNQMLSMFERAGVDYTKHYETFYDSSKPPINGKYPGRKAICVQVGDSVEDCWYFWFETAGELIG
jgi:hypothetical protein